ncbi:hypothetical protein DFQ28_008113 [Apophysomyces sp. BC1034]|nr:hypothetical protein DFQ30_006931 [Apophysomyces sp. BC1015]KAG0181521.1 hypothetical protein DFQ29_008077 [Apophysomyces sp. BC1021]KAG0192723.1 hypothetical protein DFQ28_008113 [Apophysomyces sp. BC1034]
MICNFTKETSEDMTDDKKCDTGSIKDRRLPLDKLVAVEKAAKKIIKENEKCTKLLRAKEEILEKTEQYVKELEEDIKKLKEETADNTAANEELEEKVELLRERYADTCVANYVLVAEIKRLKSKTSNVKDELEAKLCWAQDQYNEQLRTRDIWIEGAKERLTTMEMVVKWMDEEYTEAEAAREREAQDPTDETEFCVSYSVVLKIYLNDERCCRILRFHGDGSIVSYGELRRKIQQLYHLASDQFDLTYTDRDGDTILLCGYHSYRDAVERGDRWEKDDYKCILRIYVRTNPENISFSSSTQNLQDRASKCEHGGNTLYNDLAFPDKPNSFGMTTNHPEDFLGKQSDSCRLLETRSLVFPETISDVEMHSVTGSIHESTTNTMSSDNSYQMFIPDLQSSFDNLCCSDIEENNWSFGDASPVSRPDEIESISIISGSGNLF